MASSRRNRNRPASNSRSANLSSLLQTLSISEEDMDIAALTREVNLPVAILKSSVSVQMPSPRCYDKIATYINNGLCHPHIQITISSILSVRRKGEEDFPPDSCANPYRLMLWHGTTLTGAQGILQNGFVCPQTPGKLMYGNGIYFADRFSKSAQYCDVKKRLHPASGTRGYIFLCDVSLGRRYKAKNAKSGSTAAQPGYDSIKGQGQNRPDWNDNWDYFGSQMPIGPTVPDDRFTGHILQYNEYIVFDPERVHLKFLVTVDFS